MESARNQSGNLVTVSEIIRNSGKIEISMHYGLIWEVPKIGSATSSLQTIRKGQDLFLERLKSDIYSLLGKSSFDVLLIGPSLGPLANKLDNATLLCSWDSCGDPYEFASAETPSYKMVSSKDLAKESSVSNFDCVLIEGTWARYDQLSLINMSRSLLRESGTLIMFGETIGDDLCRVSTDLANEKSLLALAERVGFQLKSAHDFSKQALNTLIIFENFLQEAGILAADLSDEQQGLKDHFRKIRRDFEENLRLFGVYVFDLGKKSLKSHAEIEFGSKESFDSQELSVLFEDSFSEPFDHALWAWKYSPADSRCIVARDIVSDKIVAHYGGIPRSISYFGSIELAIQPCDVMVQPEARLKYGRDSLYFKVASTFLEREIGYSAKHLLGFGFPNLKTMRLSTRLGLYEETDEFIELSYNNSDLSDKVLNSSFINPETDLEQFELDSLWQTMREDFVSSIIGIRNFEYLNYRYVKHPRASAFSWLLIRDCSGLLKGLVVLKDHEGSALIMDIVGAKTDFRDILVEVQREVISRWAEMGLGSQRIKLWITAGWKEVLRLPKVVEKDLGIKIPCNSWNSGPKSSGLRKAWWLTAGDMDFL